MKGNTNVSYTWQVVGLWATLFGTLFGLASLIAAWIAARRAKGAETAAHQATDAATRLGRVVQLTDLIGDVQELQTMLAREDFASIADKANNLRGRVVRLRAEAYTGITDAEVDRNLYLAREQLEIIANVAVADTERSPAGSIRVGYGRLCEALNRVVALQRTSE